MQISAEDAVLGQGTLIEQFDAGQAAAALDDLVELLRDAVDGGASVGFLPPLLVEDARSYWAGVADDVGRGGRVLLVARQGTRVVGTVQLELPSKPNARHRAEVQKLLVHTRVRGQGLGRQLMTAVEAAARRAGRILLVLDTRQGDVSERLYASHGYTRAGEIPHYAQSGEGTLDTTVLYYRLLEQ